MLKIRYHTSFKKDYKKVIKRGYNTKLIEESDKNRNTQRFILVM